MEKRLTKTRAILGLALVMFVAALKRQEPVVYGMAVMLAAVGVLGWGLPWLALGRVTLVARKGRSDTIEAAEGEPLDLALELHHTGWWPAWMIEVQAEWHWAGRDFVSRDIVPLLWPGSRRPVLESAAFACRGQYRLAHLRLRSGFPLGLVHAERDMPVAALQVTVLPAPAGLQALPHWTVSEDITGEAAINRSGDSMELAMLRAYEPGESVRRVDWRASARAGGLVVRQYQYPASVLVKVMVEPPGSDEVGRPDAPAEHAVRVAAAVCAMLATQAIRFQLLMPEVPATISVATATRELAAAPPARTFWGDSLHATAAALRKGEQILAVLSPSSTPDAVVRAAHEAAPARARVLALVATWPGMPETLHKAAVDLVRHLQQAGVEAQLSWT